MVSTLVTDRLSRAVWEVVASHGIEGTSMRAVADRAGCTTGTIMHHFAGRAALLEHARRLLFEQTTARADAAEQASEDAVMRVRGVLASALPLDEMRLEESRVWLGFAAAAVASPALRAVHERGNRHWLARITRLLTATADSPVPEVVEEAAIGLIALVEGLGSLAVLDPVTYTRERLVRVLDDAVDTALRRVRDSRKVH